MRVGHVEFRSTFVLPAPNFQRVEISFLKLIRTVY